MAGGKTKMSNPQSLAQEREIAARLSNTANGLSHPPLNHRDASHSVVNRPIDVDKLDTDPHKKNEVWGDRPPIAVTVPKTPSRNGNPYERNRMSNNLYQGPSERTGNRSRGVSLDSQTEQKRRKKEHGGRSEYVPSSYFDNNAEAGPSRGFRFKVPPSHKSTELIDLQDEDDQEDLGQPVYRVEQSSPDPIDSIDHPFERSSPAPEISRDGLSTMRIREKLQQSSNMKTQKSKAELSNNLFDDIEDFPPQPGYVKSQIEKMEQQNANALYTKDPKKMKQINLLTQQRESVKMKPITFSRQQQRGSVKNMMRPKLPTQVGQSDLKDSEATSPSGYHRSPESRIISLPLDALTIGFELLESSADSELWLHFEHAKSELSLTAGPSSKNIFKNRLTNELVDSLEYTSTSTVRDSYSPIAIAQITTHSPKRSAVAEERPKADDVITLKFQVGGAKWQNGKYYDELTKKFKEKLGTVGHLGHPASTAVWEQAFNNADLAGHIAGDRTLSHSDKPDGDDDTRSVSNIASATVQRHSVPRRLPNADVQTLVTSRETRRSTRQRQSPQEDPDELLLVFPFSGPGAVNITRGDLKRFEPNEFLNDTLIEFGLKLWLADLRTNNPGLADQVHIYSSFFYKKICVKNKEQGYQSVRKWTSKIDIFNKKYLIVPINENVHWYLAIICNPEYVLRPCPPNSAIDTVKPMTRKRKRESDVFESDAGVRDEADTETTAAAAQETASSTSRTASAPPSVAPSTAVSRPRSPVDEIVPDSENDTAPVPTQHSDETKGRDENEVERLLDFNRTCSIVDVVDHRSEPMVTDMQLGYPSSDADAMEVDDEQYFPAPQKQDTMLRSAETVHPTSFYSTAGSRKGKEKADELMAQVSIESPEEDEPSADSIDPNAEQTYIFTFDSLGSRHPKACNVLSDYLVMEAKDKKGVEHASKACPRTALVPFQPNYCDCGIYLIHFVAKFMEDPAKYTRLILTRSRGSYTSVERAQDWDHGVVGTMRNNLMSRSLELSQQWKAKKEDEQKTAAARAAAEGASTRSASVVEDSDDEIIVAEPPLQATSIPRPRPRPKTTLVMKETRANTSRLRDGKSR